MTAETRKNIPELADRHARLAGIAALMMSLKFVIGAAAHYAEGSTLRVLDGVEWGVIALALALLVPMVAWKLSVPSPQERALYMGPDSFVMESMRSARKISWAVTMFGLLALEFVVRRVEVPSKVAVEVAIALMFGSFAVAFLYMTRGGEEDV